MRNTKFFKLFTTFSAWEWRNLLQFVKSPFFNKREDVVLLLQHMIKEAKKERPKYNKKQAFKIIFPKQTYSETKMNTTVSYLFKLTEQFLAIRHFQQDDKNVKWHLAQVYKEKEHLPQYKSALQNYNTLLSKNGERDSSYWWLKYQLEFENFNIAIKDNRSKKTNLNALIHAFDVTIITNKLRLACIQLSRQRLFKQEQNNIFIDEILQFLEQSPDYLEIPAIAMHYFCYKTMADQDNEAIFEKFLYWLTQRKAEFNINETGSLYLAAINFCVRRANQGEAKYWEKCLDLYQVALEERLLLQQGYLSKFTFSNIVAIGLRIQQLEWTADFIKNYQHSLNPEDKTNTVFFNWARWHIQKENYQSALDKLRFYQPNDNYHYLIAKTMFLKIYYKQEAIDSLLSLLDTMTVFLNRKEVLNEVYRLHFKNVISFMRKLLKKNSMSRNERQQLREEMLACSHFFEKEWFLKQV